MPPKSADNRLRPTWAARVPDHVIGLTWSPDGKFLAAAAVSGPVHVFDATGKPVATLAGHTHGTMAVAWKPTGELLATAGQDGKVRVWDAALWQERAAFDGGSPWVERLAFSPDGSHLASAAGKKVRVWDAAGEMVREFADHKSTVSHLAWRGSQVTVAAYGGVRLYDIATGNTVLDFAWKGAPLAIAWSPNGAMLAHGNQDATIHFWYTARPDSPLQMSGYATKVRELSWDASSRYLACGGSSAVCVWDCGGKGPEGSKPQMLPCGEEPLSAVAWQRRGYLLASGGPDGRVLLWQPANKKGPLVGTNGGDAGVTVLGWAPDDKTLAVGDADGGVRALKVN
ncbi:WD40 repeat domain-containing protein [Limnoglobus roseus]|uniref:WD-40 repeat protein n=1 Tax=Limnoglobus roseus TaxID=2598579 RepID=A0A5C1A609_9BACT|nr:WD40 repeat domain-containing protein [Limnoglobus roseus]QEL14100.1 WD-40 repeat protein [Limnoglobus roseus]